MKKLLFPVFLFLIFVSLWRWQGAGQSQSFYSRIASQVPWSDASHYVANMLRFNERGEPLDDWGCRRPWHHLHLSLWASMGFKQLATIAWADSAAVLAVLLLSAWALSSLWGWQSAVLYFFLLVLFWLRESAFSFLSENSGLFWAALAAPLLVLAWEKLILWGFLFGSLFLGLALYSRSGAFFILGVLVMLPKIRMRGGRALMATLAVIIGIGLSVVIAESTSQKVCGRGLLESNSNFSYTLYGLVTGGRSWTSFLQDYPHAKGIEELERARTAYQEAIAKIKADPWAPLRGAVRNIGFYLDQHMSILRGPEAIAEKLLVALIALLALRDFWRGDYGHRIFLMAVMAALILSSAVLVRDGHSRAFASVIPLYALVPVAWWRVEKLKTKGPSNEFLILIGLMVLIGHLLWIWNHRLGVAASVDQVLSQQGPQHCLRLPQALKGGQVLTQLKFETLDQLANFNSRAMRAGVEDAPSLMQLVAPVSLYYGLNKDYQSLWVWVNGNEIEDAEWICAGELLPGAKVFRSGQSFGRP